MYLKINIPDIRLIPLDHLTYYTIELLSYFQQTQATTHTCDWIQTNTHAICSLKKTHGAATAQCGLQLIYDLSLKNISWSIDMCANKAGDLWHMEASHIPCISLRFVSSLILIPRIKKN